jgi:hypothetical protein
MFSPLVDKNSGLEIAIEANVTKETTDNKPDSHLGKRLVRKYPIPVMKYPRYIIDQAVIPTASAIKSDSALIFVLIIVVGLTMGLVGDAINSTKISAESDLIAEAVGMTAWSIMYLGYFITGIGYLRTNLFPKWLSGLLSVVSLVTFASIAISSPEFLSTNGENIVIPLWMLNSLVLVILGIFTMRRAEQTENADTNT